MRWLLLLGLAAPAFAQPAFTVASVKPTEFLPDKRPIVTVNPGRLTLTGLTLQSLLARAYGVREFQVRGPEWIVSHRYNIAATMPEDTPEAVVWQMLQGLLTERFQLKLERGSKETPVYALVPGKNGPKLKPSEASEKTAGSKAGLRASALTPPELCNLLGKLLDRPVVDQTGLSGTYDIALEFTPDPSLGPAMSKMEAEAAMRGRESAGSSIFTAVQEQLGLRLEPRKMPLETLVVESALRVPTEN